MASKSLIKAFTSQVAGMMGVCLIGCSSSPGTDSRMEKFPLIEQYIEKTLPSLRLNGATQIEMVPIPNEEGGAILLKGFVLDRDEYQILQQILGNKVTNPDLPARIVWGVQIRNAGHEAFLIKK